MTEQQPSLISGRSRVRLDGESQPDINDALQEARIHQPLSGMASCELRLVNWAGNAADPGADFAFQRIRLGQQIEVLTGEQADAPTFSGEITALEERYGDGAPQLVLLAEDKLHRLARQRHSRSFDDLSLSDLIQQLAGEASLQADTSLEHDLQGSWHQLNESNLAFLLRLLSAQDIALRLQDNRLRVRPEEPDAEPLQLHVQQNIRQLRIIADLNRQPTSAAVNGYDLSADEDARAETSEITPAPRGTTAAGLLNQLSWGSDSIRPHPFPRSSREAEAYAVAAFNHQARRFLHGDILCNGLPGLRAGREVELNGVSGRLRGTYRVVDCVHRFAGDSGYETRIRVQRPDWEG